MLDAFWFKLLWLPLQNTSNLNGNLFQFFPTNGQKMCITKALLMEEVNMGVH